MIIDYDKRPEASCDQRMQSLMESTQLALNDIARAQQSADVAKEDAQTSVALSQTARQAAADASAAAATAKQAADDATAAVEVIEGDVSGLTTRVAQAESDIETAEGNITSLTGRVADAEGDITTIEGNVSSLTGRVADAEADISTAEGNISTLQSDVATAQGNISTIQGNITNLSGRVSDAESDITTVEGNITTLSGRVADAEDDVEDVLKGLALAEDVVGTLNWITAHSTVTTDTTPQPNTTYYIKHLDGTFETVMDTTGKNPAQEGWYVLDEALQNYVLSHLSLTNDGLWIIKDGSGYKFKLTNYGSYIVAPDGTTVVNQNTADGNIIRALDGTVIAHLGYGEGQAQSGTAVAPYYTLGIRLNGSTVGNYSVAEGSDVIASGAFSHAEGYRTTASATYSHAEGSETIASGESSHAEGLLTTASRDYSHAEGVTTTASGESSHAEGINTTASGVDSHAEGADTIASGESSHSQNEGTIAQRKSQTAIGEYNVADTTGADGSVRGDYAFIIGNGTDENDRSNGFTVDWDGNVASWNSAFERDAGGNTNGGFALLDKNGNTIAYMKALSTLDSQSRTVEGFNMGTSRDVNGSTKWNTLRMQIDADGNPVVTINQPKAWRDAIGLNSVIDAGYESVGQISANSYKDITITYSFTNTPRVVATLFTSGTAVNIGNVTVAVHAVTNTSAKVRVFNNRSSTLSPGIEWIAVDI